MNKTPPASSGSPPQSPSSLKKKVKSVVGVGVLLAGVATVVGAVGLGILLVKATPMKHLRILAVITPIMLGGGVVTSIGTAILLHRPKQKRTAPANGVTAENGLAVTTKDELIGLFTNTVMEHGNRITEIKGEDPESKKTRFLKEASEAFAAGKEAMFKAPNLSGIISQDITDNSNNCVGSLSNVQGVRVPSSFKVDLERGTPKKLTIIDKDAGESFGPSNLADLSRKELDLGLEQENLKKQGSDDQNNNNINQIQKDNEIKEQKVVVTHNWITSKIGDEKWVHRVEVEASQSSQVFTGIITAVASFIGQGMNALEQYALVAVTPEQILDIKRDAKGDIHRIDFVQTTKIGYVDRPKNRSKEDGEGWMGGGYKLFETYSLVKKGNEFVVEGYTCQMDDMGSSWSPDSEKKSQ